MLKHRKARGEKWREPHYALRTQWKALKTRPGQDSHGGTRCSTPQKLTYRVPRSNWPLPRRRMQPHENCATRTFLGFLVIPLALAAHRCNERPGIIPTLFPTVLARPDKISRKRDRNWPLPRRHYAVLVGPFTAHTLVYTRNTRRSRINFKHRGSRGGTFLLFQKEEVEKYKFAIRVLKQGL